MISSTGEWESSRTPGHPFQEYVCSLLSEGGPLWLNGTTALLSALAAVLVVACSRRMGIRWPLLTGCAFAFTPAVFLHSVSSMDYLWGLTFLLAAFHAALAGRGVWTGAWLALALASRANSLALLPAILLALVIVSPRSSRLPRTLVALAACGILTSLCFAPVVARYGVDYLSGVAVFGYPWWGFVVQYATVDVWGLLGSVALALALVAATLKIVRRGGGPVGVPVGSPVGGDTTLGWICLLGAASGFALYLSLPYESGYVVVVVPFLLMFLALHVERWVFASVTALLIVSNLVDVRSGGPEKGIILKDRQVRIAQQARIAEIIEAVREIDESIVVVAGPWQYKVLTTEFGDPSPRVEWIFQLDSALLERRYAESTIYYLPENVDWNATYYGLDLEAIDALPLE